MIETPVVLCCSRTTEMNGTAEPVRNIALRRDSLVHTEIGRMLDA